MFFWEAVLGHKKVLSVAWRLGNGTKVSLKLVERESVILLADHIMNSSVPFALVLSGKLTLGTVKVYEDQLRSHECRVSYLAARLQEAGLGAGLATDHSLPASQRVKSFVQLTMRGGAAAPFDENDLYPSAMDEPLDVSMMDCDAYPVGLEEYDVGLLMLDGPGADPQVQSFADVDAASLSPSAGAHHQDTTNGQDASGATGSASASPSPALNMSAVPSDVPFGVLDYDQSASAFFAPTTDGVAVHLGVLAVAEPGTQASPSVDTTVADPAAALPFDAGDEVMPMAMDADEGDAEAPLIAPAAEPPVTAEGPRRRRRKMAIDARPQLGPSVTRAEVEDTSALLRDPRGEGRKRHREASVDRDLFADGDGKRRTLASVLFDVPGCLLGTSSVSPPTQLSKLWAGTMSASMRGGHVGAKPAMAGAQRDVPTRGDGAEFGSSDAHAYDGDTAFSAFEAPDPPPIEVLRAGSREPSLAGMGYGKALLPDDLDLTGDGYFEPVPGELSSRLPVDRSSMLSDRDRDSMRGWLDSRNSAESGGRQPRASSLFDADDDRFEPLSEAPLGRFSLGRDLGFTSPFEDSARSSGRYASRTDTRAPEIGAKAERLFKQVADVLQSADDSVVFNSAFLGRSVGRSGAASTFGALLELLNAGRLEHKQARPYADIALRQGPCFSAGDFPDVPGAAAAIPE